MTTRYPYRRPSLLLNYTVEILLLLICFNLWSCKEETKAIPHQYTYIAADYNRVQIQATTDTLHFGLDDNAYHFIRSANVFSENGKEYVAFFEKQSGLLLIYDMETRLLAKKMEIKKFVKEDKLYRTTSYVKSFDSIFLTNHKTFYLLDQQGKIRVSIPFLKEPEHCYPIFGMSNQPVLSGNKLYTSVRPYVNYKSMSDLKKWKVIYDFDMTQKQASLHYPLPRIYSDNLYGADYLDHSYCYNDAGNFVFSFPADSLIYETNLKDLYHSYSGKSLEQKPIRPIVKDSLKEKAGARHYFTQDAYGSIYFDPVAKRYLRVCLSPISNDDFNAKRYHRKQRLLIFDERFKIIGESPIDENIQLNSLLITSTGQIYARVNHTDEYALNFVRLDYSSMDEPVKLAHYEKN